MPGGENVIRLKKVNPNTGVARGNGGRKEKERKHQNDETKADIERRSKEKTLIRIMLSERKAIQRERG